MRTLDEWLAIQESVHARSIDLGLDRVSAVAHRLGVDKPAFRVITVGGTNGKGSTVAFLEAMLRAGGVKAGAFTSPHLLRYNERIRIDGLQAEDAELIAAFERIDQARGSTTLTFFEFNALAALLVFTERQVDAAVLEVGLGGRLDAVNVVDADVAVLCSIGFDHRDWLGDTLDSIGAEKAGILRAGRPVVLGTHEMPATVFQAIEKLQAPALIAGRDFTWTVADDRWEYRSAQRSLLDLPAPSLPGAIQYRNASTAIAALEALGPPGVVEARSVSEALRAAALPGRFQIIPGPVEWILDVSHNEPAAKVLAQNLRARPITRRTYAVTSILRDKDVEAISAALKGLIDCWVLCSQPPPRGSSSAELAARIDADAAEVLQAESVTAGCELARQRAAPGDRVLVFGSFPTVATALQWLNLSPSSTPQI
jgi:dihydrofolate synthase/folylpolyglutamate synthase